MKKILIILITAIALSCSANNKHVNVSVEKLKKRIDKGGDYLVLDVRTVPEYTGPLGHIKNSTLIPLRHLSKMAKKIAAYKNKPVYVICRSGNRSTSASVILTSKGFKKVFNVLGGMRAWNNAGYPVE